MSNPGGNADRLFELAGAVCNRTASEEDCRELNLILHTDREARDRYVDYCWMHVSLRLQLRARRAAQQAHRQINAESAIAASNDSMVTNVESPSAKPINLFNTTLHGTVDYFSSGWPVAYLVATVIFGIGLLVGSLVYVSQPVQLAGQFAPTPSPLSPLSSVVGRVTAMVDCEWADEATATINGAVVPLGRKYALAAGLMEITYDTGARVILQGPCTYDVESKDGGYLSVGKVTARLEKKAEGGRRKAEESNLQSPIPNPLLSTLHSPLFTIKTPTATVTDLGTEFGVEVDNQGVTTAHVFRGVIRLEPAGDDPVTEDAAQVLHAGESARVNTDGTDRIALLGNSTVAAGFVRTLPKGVDKGSVPFEVIAQWQFDGKNFLADSSGNGHTLVNGDATQVDGTASFNGEAIMSTIDSIDLTPYRKVRVSWSQKTPQVPSSDQIVWEQTSNWYKTSGAIVAYVDAEDGYAGVATTEFAQEACRLDAFRVAGNTWEHFVMECDLTAAKRSGIVKVFKNGILIGRGTAYFGPAPASFVNAAFHIGARDGLINPFVGQIDNLKIEGEAVRKRR